MKQTGHQTRQQTGESGNQHGDPDITAGQHHDDAYGGTGTDGTVDGKIGEIENTEGDKNTDGHDPPDQPLRQSAGQSRGNR